MRARAAVVGVWLAGVLATAGWAPFVAEPRALKLGLFVATLALECVVVAAVVRVRGRFDAEDEARRPWSLIALGLGARLVAEVRLATLYFHAVPEFVRARPDLDAFYLQVLRYLYTLGDLLIAGGLVMTLRAFASLGIGLHLRWRGWLTIGALGCLPVLHFFVQRRAWAGVVMEDPGILTFRVVSVVSSALVGGLSLGLWAVSRQMGGGALAWVWGAAATAGLARALGFLVGAWARGDPWAAVVDQALLWTFACGWLMAAALRGEMAEGTGSARSAGGARRVSMSQRTGP